MTLPPPPPPATAHQTTQSHELLPRVPGERGKVAHPRHWQLVCSCPLLRWWTFSIGFTRSRPPPLPGPATHWPTSPPACCPLLRQVTPLALHHCTVLLLLLLLPLPLLLLLLLLPLPLPLLLILLLLPLPLLLLLLLLLLPLVRWRHLVSPGQKLAQKPVCPVCTLSSTSTTPSSPWPTTTQRTPNAVASFSVWSPLSTYRKEVSVLPLSTTCSNPSRASPAICSSPVWSAPSTAFSIASRRSAPPLSRRV